MIRNLIVISDTHCGCKLGLCPPDGAVLDDGGRYIPSKFQLQMWGLWEEFWQDWVPRVTHGEPYDLVHNGDLIDGVHHRSTTQISHNIEDQIEIAKAVMVPVIQRVQELGGKYYQIRGTAAHTGESGVHEERFAKDYGAIPNEEGQYARYDLWKRVGKSLVHLLHHVGTTSSSAHEASAVNAELSAEFVESARWGEEPPNFIVRSHRHRSIAVDVNMVKNGETQYAAAIVTPAWQGKTPFTWKIPGARLAQPQFGGVLIRQGDEEAHYRRQVWTISRSREE